MQQANTPSKFAFPFTRITAVPLCALFAKMFGGISSVKVDDTAPWRGPLHPKIVTCDLCHVRVLAGRRWSIWLYHFMVHLWSIFTIDLWHVSHCTSLSVTHRNGVTHRPASASCTKCTTKFGRLVLHPGDHMGVSKNRGTTKSSILIGFSLINHPFWGTIIFGNTHMIDLLIEACHFIHWGLPHDSGAS